jgi:hypothetical protein
VDREAGIVEFAVRAEQIAVHVHLDQARGRDFVEHLAVAVDQESFTLTGDPRRQVRVDQIGPAQVMHDTIERREIAAGPPFGVGRFFVGRLQRGGHRLLSSL